MMNDDELMMNVECSDAPITQQKFYRKIRLKEKAAQAETIHSLLPFPNSKPIPSTTTKLPMFADVSALAALLLLLTTSCALLITCCNKKRKRKITRKKPLIKKPGQPAPASGDKAAKTKSKSQEDATKGKKQPPSPGTQKPPKSTKKQPSQSRSQQKKPGPSRRSKEAISRPPVPVKQVPSDDDIDERTPPSGVEVPPTEEDRGDGGYATLEGLQLGPPKPDELEQKNCVVDKAQQTSLRYQQVQALENQAKRFENEKRALTEELQALKLRKPQPEVIIRPKIPSHREVKIAATTRQEEKPLTKPAATGATNRDRSRRDRPRQGDRRRPSPPRKTPVKSDRQTDSSRSKGENTTSTQRTHVPEKKRPVQSTYQGPPPVSQYIQPKEDDDAEEVDQSPTREEINSEMQSTATTLAGPKRNNNNKNSSEQSVSTSRQQNDSRRSTDDSEDEDEPDEKKDRKRRRRRGRKRH